MGSGIEGGRMEATLCFLDLAMGWGIAVVAGDTLAVSVAESAAGVEVEFSIDAGAEDGAAAAVAARALE
jgi:hypothetical protein